MTCLEGHPRFNKADNFNGGNIVPNLKVKSLEINYMFMKDSLKFSASWNL